MAEGEHGSSDSNEDWVTEWLSGIGRPFDSEAAVEKDVDAGDFDDLPPELCQAIADRVAESLEEGDIVGPVGDDVVFYVDGKE